MGRFPGNSVRGKKLILPFALLVSLQSLTLAQTSGSSSHASSSTSGTAGASSSRSAATSASGRTAASSTAANSATGRVKANSSTGATGKLQINMSSQPYRVAPSATRTENKAGKPKPPAEHKTIPEECAGGQHCSGNANPCAAVNGGCGGGSTRSRGNAYASSKPGKYQPSKAEKGKGQNQQFGKGAKPSAKTQAYLAQPSKPSKAERKEMKRQQQMAPKYPDGLKPAKPEKFYRKTHDSATMGGDRG